MTFESVVRALLKGLYYDISLDPLLKLFVVLDFAGKKELKDNRIQSYSPFSDCRKIKGQDGDKKTTMTHELN